MRGSSVLDRKSNEMEMQCNGKNVDANQEGGIGEKA